MFGVGKFSTFILVNSGIQGVGWALATVFKTDKFYDFFGSCTFATETILSLRWSERNPRQIIQSGMVLLWSFRLGSFLLTRILQSGSDRRFNQFRNSPLKLMFVWAMQGLWVQATLHPTLMLNSVRAAEPIGIYDKIGWGTWVLGFLIQSTADMQKSTFRAIPENKDKFINSGLWSLSRHPNYLGEIMMWTGLYVASLSSLHGNDRYYGLISPAFVTFLLTKVSGIPPLEKYADKKWGNNPSYQEYKRNTAVLIPFIW